MAPFSEARYNLFMERVKVFRALLVIALIMASGLFFFFYHFGTNDTGVLSDFPVAYHHFDQAISDYSRSVFESNSAGAPVTDDLQRNTGEALAELNAKASARISSLTKHDGELMQAMVEIANLAAKEFNALKAYQKAASSHSAELDTLAKEAAGLTRQRQNAYARFLALHGPD